MEVEVKLKQRKKTSHSVRDCCPQFSEQTRDMYIKGWCLDVDQEAKGAMYIYIYNIFN
jgi:hypothetical protein